MSDKDAPVVRELFIEELAEIRGGGPRDHIVDPESGICDKFISTMACGEELICSSC